MSDNSNHKGPRARKPGGAKGPHRGARGTGPAGGRAADGGKGARSSGPKGKSFSGPPGDKPFKKPFRKAPEGERPVRARPEREGFGGGRDRSADAPRSFSKGPPKGPPAKRFDKPRRVVQADPQSAPSAFEGERIAKTMARVGLCSRRDAEAWIAEGRVAVNGEVLTTPAVNVTMADRITVDGKPLGARERTRLFLYNKPKGLVTTDHDPEGRPTVFDSLPPDLPRVISIGRLDINTEGLLLLTNDGGLARVLELPSTGWLRRYRVRANGVTDQAQLDDLRKGITIEGVDYAGIEAHLDRVQGANVWLTMGLREGKNREIKRVLEHLGLAVNRLIRLSYGPFQLGELEEGAVEEVKTRIIADQIGPALAEQAGADFDSPVVSRSDMARVVDEDERPRKPMRGKPAPEAEERPRLDRPRPGPRRHVSVLRAARETEASAPRRRIERAETADRKGRAVSVERIVAPKLKKDRSETRNGRRFAKERPSDDARSPRATSGERPRTGRNAKGPGPRPDSRGERPRKPFREGPAEGGAERTFTKGAGAGKPFSKPRSEGRSKGPGDRTS
ncbi:MAG: RNA-binding protein, partial [Hyphomicrobiales bacterium]|nr:RNA-binding protein [Hyphomicrobiales bacterium]